jgi:hypothetical protein
MGRMMQKKKQFFFEKKNQKTFANKASAGTSFSPSPLWGGLGWGAAPSP